MMVSELAAKRLELLKTVVPRISRVLVLAYLADPIAPLQVKALKEAAHSLGVTLQVQDIQTADDLPAAFDAGTRERADGSSSMPKAYSLFTARKSANSRPATYCQRCTRIRSKLLTPVA